MLTSPDEGFSVPTKATTSSGQKACTKDEPEAGRRHQQRRAEEQVTPFEAIGDQPDRERQRGRTDECRGGDPADAQAAEAEPGEVERQEHADKPSVKARTPRETTSTRASGVASRGRKCHRDRPFCPSLAAPISISSDSARAICVRLPMSVVRSEARDSGVTSLSARAAPRAISSCGPKRYSAWRSSASPCPVSPLLNQPALRTVTIAHLRPIP